MIFNCRQCNRSEEFRNQKDAYMAGWFLGGMTISGYMLPYRTEICYKCGTTPMKRMENVEHNESEDQQ